MSLEKNDIGPNDSDSFGRLLFITEAICLQAEGGENKSEGEAEQASEGAQEEAASPFGATTTPRKSAKKKKVRSGKAMSVMVNSCWHSCHWLLRWHSVGLNVILIIIMMIPT